MELHIRKLWSLFLANYGVWFENHLSCIFMRLSLTLLSYVLPQPPVVKIQPRSRVVVVHPFNPSTEEVEAGRSL